MALTRRPTVLVIRALALGDLLTAVPALRALRRGLPGAQITLAAPVALAPLIPLIGAVDRLRPTADLAALQTVRARPDLVVNLHGRGPESIAAALAMRPGVVLSYAHPAFPLLSGPAWQPELHEIDRWCDLLAWAGLAVQRADLALARPLLPVPADARGATVIHPGASAGARRWPPTRFGQVAAELARAGHQVLVTGSAAEVGLADAVVAAAHHPGVRSLAGRLRLDELAALVAAAGLVVCGDTGVAHLATAYQTPSVVLFGPTPPAQWGPPASGPHRVLWHGRRGDPHAAEPDPGLLLIEVSEVLAAAADLGALDAVSAARQSWRPVAG